MVGIPLGCWNYEPEQRTKLITRIIFLLSIASENSRIDEYNPTTIAVNLVNIWFCYTRWPQAFPDLPYTIVLSDYF